jgi:hypothetical protein
MLSPRAHSPMVAGKLVASEPEICPSGSLSSIDSARQPTEADAYGISSTLSVAQTPAFAYSTWHHYYIIGTIWQCACVLQLSLAGMSSWRYLGAECVQSQPWPLDATI